MKVDLIIFDLDGTLVNSIPDLTDSLNYVACNNNLSLFDEQRVVELVGGGIAKLIEMAFEIDQSEDNFSTYFNQFMKHYKRNFSNRSYLYKNVPGVLEYFETKKMAILSNKVDYLTKHVAIDYSIYGYFDLILGATEGLPKKPSAEPILYILKKLNIDASKAIMVGDSEPDIISAKNAGIKSVALTSGYRSKNQLEKLAPDFIIDDIIDLKMII